MNSVHYKIKSTMKSCRSTRKALLTEIAKSIVQVQALCSCHCTIRFMDSGHCAMDNILMQSPQVQVHALLWFHTAHCHSPRECNTHVASTTVWWHLRRSSQLQPCNQMRVVWAMLWYNLLLLAPPRLSSIVLLVVFRVCCFVDSSTIFYFPSINSICIF